MTTLAIIPARGGSKSVPLKNIRLLAGKPLIQYTIEAAKLATRIDQVAVSTDNAEIAAIAQACGAEIIWRPSELAQDHSPTLPTLQHALETLQDTNVSIVVTLQATSPLRKWHHIDNALDGLEPDYDSVIAVCEAIHTPYKMLKIEENVLVSLFPEVPRGLPRQSLPVVFRENGAIYVSRRHILLEQNSIYGQKARPYIMDEAASLDIDSELDFQFAEFLLQQESLGNHDSV